MNRDFDGISKAEIESVVSAGISERRTLDYKQELPGNADGDKKEFLADVSSFANAAGGDLIYGIPESRDPQGQPTSLPDTPTGLAVNAGAEISRLENIIRDGIDPRIPGVQMKAVDGFANGPVFVLRIPKSWAAPHMVIFKGHSRFYSRNSSGKYPLDVREIRSAFALSESRGERIRSFRQQRLAQVVAGETPVPLEPGPKLVIHVVPLPAMNPFHDGDISTLASQCAKLIAPISMSSSSHRHNLDGYLSYTPLDKAGNAWGYVQVFRSGAIEAVDAHVLDAIQANFIASSALEEAIVKSTARFLEFLKQVGNDPIVLMVTLLDVKGRRMALRGQRMLYEPSLPIDRRDLIVPDLLIEDFQRPTDTIVKPVLDVIWQASGVAGSPNYDESGRRAQS